MYGLFATFRPYYSKTMWFIHLKTCLGEYQYVLFTCAQISALSLHLV